ncbi:MAG: hypothetical protein ACI3T9_01960 [Romboutsia timonensis]
MEIKHNYNLLATAIIKQAVDDYISNICSDREFKRFLYSDFFVMLSDIDADYLLRLANREKV